MHQKKTKHLILKRILIGGVIGLTTLFILLIGVLFIFAFWQMVLMNDTMDTLEAILGSLFGLIGLFLLIRSFPEFVIYLLREIDGRYELDSLNNSLLVLPRYGSKKIFELKRIEGVVLHKCLIRCSAISIIVDGRNGITFGNLHSTETKNEIVTWVKEKMRNHELNDTVQP